MDRLKTSATPASVRVINRRMVLDALLRCRTASRADLAKAVGMSQVTAGKIVDSLLEQGILEEINGGGRGAEAKSGRLGRPGQMLRLESRRSHFLTMQLGVLHTRLAEVSLGFAGTDTWGVEFITPRTAEEWAMRLKGAARQLANKEFWGILVSVPGIVDEGAGKVLYSPNVHWTESTDLPRLLNEIWAGPVSLVQEIRALARGQLVTGTAGEDFLLVDFGHGVGGAAVVGGRLFNGALPLSGELGHDPVVGNARRCGCGAVGCVETLMSRRGLFESYVAEYGPAPYNWPLLVKHVGKHGLEPWLTRSLDAAATAICGALNVLGLRRAIVTGTLTELPEGVMQYLSEAVTRGALWARFGQVVCQGAPRHRIQGLVSVGIDQLIRTAAEAG